MKEFMLLVRPGGGHLDELSTDEKQQHLNNVVAYIEQLVKDKKLIGAQPLSKGGSLVAGTKGNTTDGPFIETKEEIAGYFHIYADNLEQAVEIARQNPMFQLAKGGTVEVRPIQSISEV